VYRNRDDFTVMIWTILQVAGHQAANAEYSLPSCIVCQ
jgi:hypothetical protein